MIMLIYRIATALWEIVRTDRTVHAGVSTSGVSLWGAHAMGATPLVPPNVQIYAAFFATLFGGLSAAAVFVYTCLKIVRLLRSPAATE